MKLLQKKFRRRNPLDILLSEVVDDVKQAYDGRAIFRFDADMRCGNGLTWDDMSQNYPLHTFVGVKGIFADMNAGQLKPNVCISDLVPVIVAMYHESRHVEQFGEIRESITSDAQCMALNHLECHGSANYMQYNWNRFITEIDAERCGISNAGAFLAEYFSDDEMADKLLLDYVNSRVSFGGYFIQPPKGKSAYDNMDDVLDAFDAAYENAKHAHRDYLIPGCVDPNYQFMQNNMNGSARDMLYFEPDGAKQAAMMSAIVLYRHPEYKGWHKSLENMDLSMDTMFGKDWHKNDKSRQNRRLPDVLIDTYDPSGQYEP